jgi:hypothetical protein
LQTLKKLLPCNIFDPNDQLIKTSYMKQHTNKRSDDSGFVMSYLNLRKAVGILGIALPVVLFFGFLLLNKNCTLPPSISHYFYTNLGTYFTGTLCAVALFLFSYKGPEKKDERAAMVASFCALGVAFCPTNPYSDIINDSCISVTLSASKIRNGFHYGFAATLFLTLAYFSLVLFTKTSGLRITKEKRTRNGIYKACGWIILASIAGIIIVTFMEDKPGEDKALDISTFIFETVALFAFGFSWLIKGETFFTDEEKSGVSKS